MKVMTCILLFMIPLTVFSYKAEVISVHDADTIKVIYAGSEVKLRLYGIDAPEISQEYGLEARQALQLKIQGKSIDIKPQGKDQYDRVLAMIYLGGENINEWLIRNGLAWVYTGYCKKDFCLQWYQVEKKARDSQSGLWSQDMPQAPWIFRKEMNRPAKKERPKQEENPVLASIIIVLLALGILPFLRKGLLKNYVARKLKKGKRK